MSDKITGEFNGNKFSIEQNKQTKQYKVKYGEKTSSYFDTLKSANEWLFKEIGKDGSL